MRVMPLEPLSLVRSLVRSLAIALVKSLVLELAQSPELATTQTIFALAVSHRPIAVVWLPSPRALN